MKNKSLKVFIVIIVSIFLIQSCKNENNNNQKYKQADFGGTNELGFSNDYIFNDGDYCSEVLVYNPHTGKKSHYNLTVTIFDNKLTKIYFPNGGWLDNSHFEPPKTNDNQIFEFTDDRDYEYTVAILNDIKECDEVKESVKNIYQKKSDTAQLIKETKKKSLFENTINNGFQGVSPTIKKSKEIYNPSKDKNK